MLTYSHIYLPSFYLFLYIGTLGEKAIQTVSIVSSHGHVNEGFNSSSYFSTNQILISPIYFPFHDLSTSYTLINTSIYVPLLHLLYLSLSLIFIYSTFSSMCEYLHSTSASFQPLLLPLVYLLFFLSTVLPFLTIQCLLHLQLMFLYPLISSIYHIFLYLLSILPLSPTNSSFHI